VHVKNVIKFRNLAKEDQDRYSVAINNVFKVKKIDKSLNCIAELLKHLVACHFFHSVCIGRTTMPKADAC
jgi:hypothetical protein